MSIGRFDSMAKEFVPGVTLATSLLPIQRANEFTLRQPASYSGALNTPPASFALQLGFRLIETSSMSDHVHQFTACSNTPASDLVAGMFEKIRDTSAAVKAAVPANTHAFHHASTPHQGIAELRSSVLASEKVTAAACRLMNARTPELMSYTPTNLPSEVGRAAQPAKINAWSPTTTGGREHELQGYLMYMAGLTDRKIHHINWCGKIVFGRTATPPAVSLCIIVAPPKEYFDFQINLCTSVLLHNALRLVDPILFTGDFDVLNSCSGTTLQNAVIGSCHKFYNKRGCWSLDELGADEDFPVLDSMDVHDYGTGDTILNGWFSTRNVRVRSNLFSYSAEFAKKYHAARKPAMEEIACGYGEGMQKRVLRQSFVKSPLRRVVHCSQIDDIYFSATMTAAAASRRPQVKPVAQRSLDGDELVTTSGSTTEVARTGSVIATKRAERLPRTGDPELAKLLEMPEETSYDKQSGSATENSVFKHKTQSWEPDSDTASQVYFKSGSASGAATDAISIAASPPSIDGMVTMLDVKRPVLGLAKETGTGDEMLSPEHNSEAHIYNYLSATRSVSNETQQPVSENVAAATLALDCAFAAELDLPGLVELRSPLPTFKRARPSARQASWTSFRSKVRNVSFGDRRPSELEEVEGHEGSLQSEAECPALSTDIASTGRGLVAPDVTCKVTRRVSWLRDVAPFDCPARRHGSSCVCVT